jgi:hypothetical protein
LIAKKVMRNGVHDIYREKHNLIVLILVMPIGSIAFVVIIDLDQSNVGLLQLPQKTLIGLGQKLNLMP